MNALQRFATWLGRGRTAVIGVPYAWLLVFFLFPFLILLKISVSEMETVVFKDLISFKDGLLQLTLKLSNYQFMAEDTLYIKTYVASLKYAFATTVLCLAIGYPFAYFMARAKPTAQPALLMLVMLPFWTSFLLRVYAWKGPAVRERLGGRPADRRRAGPCPGRHRRDQHAGQADEHAVLAGAGHDLHLPALHGAAAVWQPGQDGPAGCWKRPPTWAPRRGRRSGRSRCR